MRTATPFYLPDANGCWIWQGSTTSDGYGRMWVPELKAMRQAHRVFYEKAKGTIPVGAEIDHLCRNTLCVNPEHLEAVPHAINYQRSSRIVLTSEQVAEIRRRYAAGGVRQVALASEFGVGQSHISQIVRGTIWS